MEHLLYGLAKGETERYTEWLLATGLQTPAQIDKIKEIASNDGFHSFRVAKFDGGAPDFTKTLA